MRVLLVEDSPKLRRTIAIALRKVGYVVDAAADGPEGLWLAESNSYDTIILDLMLPGMDGLSLLRKLREGGRNAPVLILTVKGTVEDRVTGLRAGADDYLAKPFALEELLARVGSLVRRNYGQRNPMLRVADLELDTDARTAVRAGRRIDLQPREYRLLEFLIHHQGKVVTRAQIEEHIYDSGTELFSNAVESTISSLRKKLEAPNSPPLIHTRRGVGYTLHADSE